MSEIQLPLEIVAEVYSYIRDYKTVQALKEIGPWSRSMAEEKCCSGVKVVILEPEPDGMRTLQCDGEKTSFSLYEDDESEKLVDWFAQVIRGSVLIREIGVSFQGVLISISQDILNHLKDWKKKTLRSLHINLNTFTLDAIDRDMAEILRNYPGLRELEFQGLYTMQPATDRVGNDSDFPKHFCDLEMVGVLAELKKLNRLKFSSCATDRAPFKAMMDREEGLVAFEPLPEVLDNDFCSNNMQNPYLFVSEVVKNSKNLSAKKIEKVELKCFTLTELDGYNWTSFPDVQEVNISVHFWTAFPESILWGPFQESVLRFFQEFDSAERHITVNIVGCNSRVAKSHRKPEQSDLDLRCISSSIQEYNEAQMPNFGQGYEESSFLQPVDVEMAKRGEWINNLWVIKKRNSSFTVNLKFNHNA